MLSTLKYKKQLREILMSGAASGKKQNFYKLLLNKGFSERSSTEHKKNIERFEIWAKEENYMGINELNYNELLG